MSRYCFILSKLIKRFFFLIFFLIALPSFAQNTEEGLPFITNYAPNEYKSSQVWSIVQDNDGIMYFGIQGGIMEYDGVKWQKIAFDAKQNGLVIRSLTKDKNGKIFYGSYQDFGYLKKNSQGQTKIVSLVKNIPEKDRDFFDVWSICVADNGIYFQTREKIFWLEQEKGSEKWKVKTWKPQTRFMYSFYFDHQYYIHEQGLGIFQMVNDSITLIPGSEFLGKERVQVMLPYPSEEANKSSAQKKYLIGMAYGSLYLYDGKTFTPFKTEAESFLKSGGFLYRAVQLKNNNYVLCTTGNGIVEINTRGELIKKVNRSIGLQDETVYAAYVDNNESLWLGLDNGISKIAISSPFTQFSFHSGINTSVLNVVRYQDDIYIGTSNGIMKYNKSKGIFEQNNFIPKNQAFAFWKDKDGLLIGSGDGLFKIKNGKTYTIYSDPSGNSSVLCIHISDQNPDILFCGGANGIAVFERNKKPSDEAHSWVFKEYIPGIREQIWTISEDKDGILWAGSQGTFVYKLIFPYDGNGNPEFDKAQIKILGSEQGLKNGSGTVYEINKKNYVIADSSIYSFNKEKQRFVIDTTFGIFKRGGGNQNGLMTEDSTGRVWVSLGQEIKLATPLSNGKYRVEEVMQSINEKNYSAIYPDKDGIVWIATTDGLIRFDENDPENTEHPFNILLRNASIEKDSLNIDPSLSGKGQTQINFTDNTLRFEYAAPYFNDEKKTQYQTWLEGYDKNWSSWGFNSYKEYTNLSDGKYVFHVRAKNILGKISSEVTYTFTILPPWYRTWWAYLLYSLAVASIIYFLIKWRTRQLEAKHHELEKIINERTAQLSSKVKELAVINNVQEGLVSKMDMQSIYDLVGNKIRDSFEAQVTIIGSFEDNQTTEHFNYVIENDKRYYPSSRPVDKLRKVLIESKQKMVIRNKEESKKWFDDKAIDDSKPVKSAVFVPLMTGDKVNRYISLQNVDKENAFSDSDINLLETLANSMSVALENARLFDETTRLLKETEQRTSELAVINSVQEGLVAQLDIQSIYDLVGEKIRNIFNAQIMDIVTYDKKKNLIEDRYAYEKGDRTLLGAREPLGFRKHIINTRQLLLINENLDDKSKEFESYVTIGEQPKSALFVPMITGGEVTGIISLQDLDHEHVYSNSAVNLLTTLANSMSVALKSAGLFDETNRLLKETEQRNAELAVINSVQESLVAKLDMAGIYELVGEKIRQIFSAQVIDIVTYDSGKNMIVDQYAYEKGDRTLLGEREPKGFRKHVIKTGVLLLHNENVMRAMREFDNEVLIGDPPKSQIYVPMIAEGKVKGIISLQNLDHEHAFSDSDVSLLTTLANSMSVALESARLFDETNRLLKETEQRTSELAVINSVQEDLVAQMDTQSIYDLVGEKIKDIFNAQVIDIVVFNKKKNLLEDKYSFERNHETQLMSRAPFGFRKFVIESHHLFLVNEKMNEKSKEYNNGFAPGNQMPKSALFVPMITGGEVTGIISLQNLEKEFAFSDSQVNLLTTLANSMNVALKSAGLFDQTTRLLKETEQRNAELAVINSVQESLVGGMNMSGIYELVGEKMREIFNAQVIDIVTFDSNRNVITDKYSYEKGDRTLVGERKPTGFRKHVIQTGSILVHNENVANALKEYDNEIIIGEIPKSQIYVPMLADGKVKGIISLQNLDQEHAFSDSDISLLTTLTNSMSVALESARLFDETTRLLKETEQRNSELAVITSIQESLVAKMDVEAIYSLVGEKIREVFNAQVIDITTYDRTTNLIEDKYSYEKGDRTLISKREPLGFRKHVIESGQMLVINKDMYKHRLIYENTIVVGQGAKSMVMAPLMSAGKVNGIISLQNLDKENAFSDSEISLLSTLVNSMSVALKSARLFDETTRLLKETEERTAELGVINSVQEGLARELNPQSIYKLVGDRLCELFPETQTLVIRTFDSETQLEHWQYAKEKGVKQLVEPRPLNWNSKELIRTKKPLNINENYVETAKKYGGSGVIAGQPPKSAVFVPMIIGDIVKGSVSLQNIDNENAFTDSNMRLLTTIANSMSVALENARLFNETKHLLSDAKQRASELTTVNNISRAIASQLNPNELIQLVGDQIKNLFSANIVYLALFNEKTKMIHFPYQFGELMASRKIGDGLTSKIIISKEPILINEDVELKTEQMGVTNMGRPAASYLGVPIPVGDEIIGVMSVQSTEHENRFNDNDQRLLSTIASSVGVALNNAQLFEDVEQAKMEAEKASKVAEKANEAKSAFLSTVSHELRTPLTSVLGFAKIISKRLNDKIFPALNLSDPKTEKTVNQITENLHVVISEGERLTHLINDVLDLAKIEAGRMEWNQEKVSLAEVAERAIAATTSLFEQKNLKLIRKIDQNVPDVIGDADKLIQVVINLFSNSVKFTEKGSVTCEVKQKDNEVVLSIIDTGIGIASQDYSAVFEQFKQVGGDTLTDKPKGTGLGLPICKEIVEHHGGHIWVESKVGKGSTFSFAIPFMPSENKNKKEQKPIHLDELVKQLKEQMVFSKLQIDGKSATILIVDDDDSIRSLLEQELGEAGYLIEQATNGKAALESIRNRRPDLIILDVMMPEMNGFDVAAILKNDPQTMDIPIIILSIIQDKARGFRIGVDRYLTKPIDTPQLFREVGNLLEQGKSKKKVMVVDEDSEAVRALTDVLQTKGYQVVESNGEELAEKAIATKPDIIILNSIFSGKQEIVKTLRFEKGLENVLFFIYQ